MSVNGAIEAKTKLNLLGKHTLFVPKTLLSMKNKYRNFELTNTLCCAQYNVITNLLTNDTRLGKLFMHSNLLIPH